MLSSFVLIVILLVSAILVLHPQNLISAKSDT